MIALEPLNFDSFVAMHLWSKAGARAEPSLPDDGVMLLLRRPSRPDDGVMLVGASSQTGRPTVNLTVEGKFENSLQNQFKIM